MQSRRNNHGFTLLETLLYVGLLVVVVVFANSFAVAIIRTNASTERKEQVREVAAHALDIINKEIRLAKSVYTETSVFGTSPGQLSLETGEQLPSGETTTYVDVYIDDAHVYIKREGQSPELITSEDIRITNFTLTHLTASGPGSAEAIRIDMTAAYDAPLSGSAVRLMTTSSLRSYNP